MILEGGGLINGFYANSISQSVQHWQFQDCDQSGDLPHPTKLEFREQGLTRVFLWTPVWVQFKSILNAYVIPAVLEGKL